MVYCDFGLEVESWCRRSVVMSDSGYSFHINISRYVYVHCKIIIILIIIIPATHPGALYHWRESRRVRGRRRGYHWRGCWRTAVGSDSRAEQKLQHTPSGTAEYTLHGLCRDNVRSGQDGSSLVLYETSSSHSSASSSRDILNIMSSLVRMLTRSRRCGSHPGQSTMVGSWRNS